MNSLLLEIGTEEIPAGYIKPALEALRQIWSADSRKRALNMAGQKLTAHPAGWR